MKLRGESLLRSHSPLSRSALLVTIFICMTCFLTGGCSGKPADYDSVPGSKSGSQASADVVAVPASEWQGIDVFDNRRPHSEPTNYKYGQKWQCVELVQRLYATKWGYPSIWPVARAYQMWEAAPDGIEKHENGDMDSAPQWGDVIVFGQKQGKGYGHVSIVVGRMDGRVFVLQQNSGNGREVVSFGNNHMLGKHGGLPALGWLHAPQNRSALNITW